MAKKKTIKQSDIHGGKSVEDAAKIFKTILEGKGSVEQNNVVLTNAAFALGIVDVNKDFETAYAEAKDSLLGGKAKDCLHKLIG